MNDIYNIKINKESQSPLYQQLANGIINLIEDRTLLPNSRLPSIRNLSDKLNINNNTVINAYRYLENKKIVYSKAGSGTYVTDFNRNGIINPITSNNFIINREVEFNLKDAFNFAANNTSASLFPVSNFKKYLGDVLERDKGNAFYIDDSKGYLPLRESLIEYLEGNKPKTTPDHVHIITGVQQGIDILSQVLLSYGDIVFVECPTHHSAISVLLARGVQIIEVPMCKDGIDTTQLKDLIKIYKPKVIYITSYFQHPTSVSYSYKKKQHLIDIANNYNIYIIEEDVQSELSYTKDDIVTLKSLDNCNKVIYIKSFSNILIPGLRIGFMILPSSIDIKVTSIKYNTGALNTSIVQKAFDLYIKSGELANHISNMINIFEVRYKVAVIEIDKELKPYVTYCIPNGGVSFWLKLNNMNIDIEHFCNRLLINKVVVSPGSMFYIEGDTVPYIHISYAQVELEEIKKGIKLIGNIFKLYNDTN